MEINSKSNSSNMNDEASKMNVKDNGLRKLSSYEILLRILAFLSTLTASILVAVNKETKIIPVPLFQTLPPLQVHVTAKWQYLSASVFLLVSNIIACSYAAGSIVYSMAAKGGRSRGKLVIIILDMMITWLLFSANGAETAVGMIGRYGNSHARWNKICDVFSAFCNHMIVALALSFLGTVLYLFLVMISVLNLYKKSSS